MNNKFIINNGLMFNKKNYKEKILNPVFKYNINDCNNFIIFNQKKLYEERVYYNLHNNDLTIKFPKNIYPDYQKAHVKYEYEYASFLCESCYSYLIILDICIKNNIKFVLDVGCSAGIQSLFFNEYDIKYFGIDKNLHTRFFPYYINNQNDVQYQIVEFPNKVLIDDKNYCLISSLCLFWLVDISDEEYLKALLNYQKIIIHMPNNCNIVENKLAKFYNIIEYHKDIVSRIVYLEKI